ncbi:MAG: alpha/beta hydrolase [Verrucomicrobia bacterium]|nr:alpha/beta hydrolase [Verrucomicrobiota bacterium]
MDESSDHYHSTSAGGKLYRRVFTPLDCAPAERRGGVLLVHGLGDHLGCHEKAARMFCRRGMVAAGLDWPGHGHSDGKRGHSFGLDPLMELITESLADLRERIPAGSPIGLYAHSAGAFVLLQYLRDQALKGEKAINPPSSFSFVWLSSPLLRPDYGQGLVKRKVGEWLSKIVPSLLFDTGVCSDRCYPPDPESGLLKEDPLKHHKVSLALGSDFIKRSHRLNDCALAFEQPTHLFISQGDVDQICPMEFSREFFEVIDLPSADKIYRVLPGVLHEPLNDPIADALLAELSEWVDQALIASAGERTKRG